MTVKDNRVGGGVAARNGKINDSTTLRRLRDRDNHWEMLRMKKG